ncbi:unnamed protein product [Paramecium sonneborni]|uniref:Transmembrane protein n=1 Tax=Paramecium sonneborni TaxID=65129 RepID=A0A8S1RTB3_9CILI|nr:unnamed protein product [Paramecium sonneborni]
MVFRMDVRIVDLYKQNCKNNYLSICLKCEEGYQNQENKCLPYCGDKIILKQYEDRDDGNEQPYDGCFQCKFQCIEDCNICDRGQCIFKCEHGYKFVNNNCQSVCGDKIVTKEEYCDDGNLQPQDGCFNCKYSCSENCYDCYQGTCLECNNQYQLLMSNQFMQQINCGDGLLQEQEECDDGNYQAVDGCFNCLIEENWICITMTIDSPSQCTFVKAPKLIINYLNMTQNKQYIRISFDQRVKIQTTQPLSETINLQLLNIEEKKWNSSLYILQDVGSNVNFGEFIAQIEVYQLLEFRPVLKILINQTVSNIDNAVVKNVEKSILLQYPTYLDQTQKDYSKSLKNLNQNVIYSLSGITGFSLLIGELELFFEVLSILQFQQYLRYINLQFQENLVIYFSFNDMITVQPLLVFVQFSQLLQLIDIEQNEEYTHGKFRFYKQNISLIINLQCQLLQLLMYLLFIFSFQWLKKFVYNQIFCSRYFNYMSLFSLHISPKIVIKLSQYFYNICINLLKLEKYNSFSGLQKALLINGWDMIFKTLLYLRHIETKNYIDIEQIIIVIIILILYFKIFSDCFKSQQKQSKNNLLQQFEIVSFVRQFFFLLFLIYVDKSEILQIELLLLTSLFQITLIYNYRFIFNKQLYCLDGD